MTNEELVLAYMSGEDTLGELYVNCKGLIAKVYKRWKFLDGYNHDDLFGILTEHFIDAIPRYNKDKGVLFSTFITSHLHFQMCNLYKSTKNKKSETNFNFASLNEEIKTLEEMNLDMDSDSYGSIYYRALVEIVNGSMGDFSEKKKTFVKEYLYNDLGYTEIGKKYGASRQSVRQLTMDGLKSIQRDLVKQGWTLGGYTYER